MNGSIFGWLLVAALLLFALWLATQPLRLRRRRRRLARLPLTTEQKTWLAQTVACYPRLSEELAERFRRQLQIFLHEKHFYGCGGFEVRDRVRVAIAGQACLLRLQPGADCYPDVREILVYPSAFWVHHEQPDEIGLVDDDPDLLAGEAWQQGRVVLSWEDIAAALEGGATNVVVHEFAHQLDYETPGTEGAPQLADYGEWAAVFAEEFHRLHETDSPVIDAYGAENPAEFFAVAAETYIQRGAELARHHPDLYRLMREYFLIDTAATSRFR